MKKIRSPWEDDEEVVLEDESIYSEDTRNNLVDNDEISAMEAGFMQGWNDA